ncbi:MAG: peptidase S41 [Muribaculum sp.]|nr:peptidase S41 [Muribaculum sp.]
MKVYISIIAALTAFGASAVTPLWLRDVKISPDGTNVAFTYKGDIYKVSADGGTAVRLTASPSIETEPVWSPDGSHIAFASSRNGGQDIYVMSADGGDLQRLTHHSAIESPETFTPDGKYVVFSASLQDPAESVLFPSSRLTELYRVPVGGGRVERVIASAAQSVSYVPDGSCFIYQDKKGFEDTWRKHHTSSVTRDIWSYDVKSGRHRNLTSRPGEDLNPVVSPDGKTVYFLSERDGKTLNVYSMPVDNPASATQLTDFTVHPVRFLSRSDNGRLAFAYDGEIYTMTEGASPKKLDINIVDNYENSIEKRNVGSSAYATVSPDGKQVAFIDRGELFVTSVDYKTTRQITHTAAAEKQITWAPGGRALVYVSERDGIPALYRAMIVRDDDLNFPNATLIDEQPLLPVDGVERTCPQYSPDGSELAFIADRNKLMVLDIATKRVRQITDGSTYAERNGGFDYSWSPDGKWIVMELTNNGHEPYSDIAIVNTTGTPKVTNITLSSYFDMQPKWALDGNAIAFLSDRYGMRNHASWGSLNDVMMVFLNQDAYDKYCLSKEDYELRKELEKQQKERKQKSDDKKKDKKGKKDAAADKDDEDVKDINVELDGIRDRIVRVTPNSSDIGDFIITKDGEELYYLSAFEQDYDLWSMNLRKKDTGIVKKLDAGLLSLELDKDGDNLFLLGSDELSKMPLSSKSIKPISYSARMDIDRAAEREYMFDYVKREAKERFYTVDMHGVDWEMMTDAYRRFLPHINNNHDFAELLSELLGELNASHTGGRYSMPSAVDQTASLGLIYDWNYAGPGLKVSEVIENGPFDNASSDMAPGVVVEKINGNEIGDSIDFTILFNNIRGKKTLVALYDPVSGKRWEEVVLPVGSGVMSDLLYDRWVKRRAADVDKWSGGRLGYVHIRSMDDASYRTIYADLLGKYVDKDGIVIDTRWNGGGRLHEDIEVLFSGDKYLTQVIRGVDVCDMPSRRWNKPSIMVQCEANYSNAHGTPWVYKHKKLGTLVGMPVPGTMTSVNWITLQDRSLVFGVPVIGYRTAEGNYLENSQLEPDIKVANDPADAVAGEDAQLHRAVTELLRQLD